jgi:oligoendopeptidase F
MRGYPDFPHETHFGLYLETDQVKALFKKLADAAEINKRYQRLRVAHIKQFSGLDDVNVWDYNIVPPGKERPRFTIGDASREIIETLKPFGQEYGRELAGLLNPDNGRMDIVPGDNRVPGAFAWGFPNSQISIFYDFNFEGYFDDVSALIHESGHAVHYQLMGVNHVPPVYVSGPIYFFEAFAMFNELLLADRLYKQETDTFKKTYYLERFLNQSMAVFGITRQAAIEQAAYDEIQAGRAKNADDLDKMALKIGSQFSIWFPKHPELADEWIDVHHFYTQPMYYVNYVYANFLALKFYEMYERDPKAFVPKYIALVKNGFDGTPTELLGKFLGISMTDPKLVSDTFGLLEGKLKELDDLYSRPQ